MLEVPGGVRICPGNAAPADACVSTAVLKRLYGMEALAQDGSPPFLQRALPFYLLVVEVKRGPADGYEPVVWQMRLQLAV